MPHSHDHGNACEHESNGIDPLEMVSCEMSYQQSSDLQIFHIFVC